MRFGYMRVSTAKRGDDGEFVQNFDLQREALEAAGVDRIFEDRASGVKAKREGLAELLAAVNSGDEVLVWKLDRLGRNARDLLEIAEQLKSRGVTVRSIQDGIDTAGKFGSFLFTILSAVAELERENISERVTAGIAASVRHGGRIGRKKALSAAAVEDVRASIEAGVAVAELAKRYRVDRATIYRSAKY